ncbi:MAG: CatB-related O-acetyltransferase [Desulfobulbaceae bacterium]|nr:CatB-related O-acetyltransferase [Desulfobulbaceae bacterium]
MSFTPRIKRFFGRRLYGVLRSILRRQEMTSLVLRKARAILFDVEIGLYSYGCFDPERIASGTTIGRYCSFAPMSYRFNGNHGIDFLSLHPYLYNPRLGMVDKETIVRTRCTIEDDVWVGHAAIILPSVAKIGRGAVIAAGSVVTKDVPPYAICAGNPAKVIRYRFDGKTIAQIEKTQWWLMSKEELSDLIRLNPELVYRPANAFWAEDRD